MNYRIEMGVSTALILFGLLPALAGGKIYTNKDLEKYSNKRGKEATVKYNGKKVSLDFTDASLTAVFSLISDIARQDGYTLLVDPGIKERITLKIANVPWDEALDFLTESHNLVKAVKDKTITISPGKQGGH